MPCHACGRAMPVRDTIGVRDGVCCGAVRCGAAREGGREGAPVPWCLTLGQRPACHPSLHADHATSTHTYHAGMGCLTCTPMPRLPHIPADSPAARIAPPPLAPLHCRRGHPQTA